VSEYLNEEEQVARLKSWWDENGTSIVVTLVLGVAAIFGWQWYQDHRTGQSHEASRAYAEFKAAEGDSKTTALEHLAENYNGTAYHVFGLFSQAQAAVATGELTEAETHLAEILAVADDALLIDLAKVRLAKVQNGLDRSGQALETLASLSSEGYRAWGLEAKGDIHVARGEIELAHTAYVAANASLEPGDQRPILDMKLKNVAPFEGEYVQFADTLETALQQAQETLDSQSETAVEASDEAVEVQVDASDVENVAEEPDEAVEPDAETAVDAGNIND
jgi:predicted negative regulator of RcsB-dependent stress response